MEQEPKHHQLYNQTLIDNQKIFIQDNKDDESEIDDEALEEIYLNTRTDDYQLNFMLELKN